MLSNKWTFSLTSLVVMLALAFAVPSAMAEFAATLSVGAGVDISSADGVQVERDTTDGTMINIKFDKVVDHAADAAYGTAADASYCKWHQIRS